MIYHVTPWRTGDIGAGLNAAIEPLPPDAWVCARDGDTMFLTPSWGAQVEAVVEAHGDYDLIGCVTNRLRGRHQLHGGALSGEPDIGAHVAIAQARWAEHGPAVKELHHGAVAGAFMLFRRSTWERVRFVERTIWADAYFTKAVRGRRGARVGIALGLYLFHLYRWGHPNPADSIGHLPR